MARDEMSLAEQDERKRRAAAEASATQARQAELTRREAIRTAQEAAQQGALPPLVRAA